MKLNGLDLFSGIAGAALALAAYVRQIAYCESYEPAQNNLFELQQKGEIPIAPIWDDIRTLQRRHIGVPVDIITGGWPCQDISPAGTRKGLGGERSKLIVEVFRLIREFEPRYVFVENSPMVTVSGLQRILLDLYALGYDARWTVVSAEEMGAPHLRERFWLLAHANGNRVRIKPECVGRSEGPTFARYSCEASAADASGLRWRTWRPDGEQSRDPEINSFGDPHFHTLRKGRQRWIDAEGAWTQLALGGGGGGWPSWLPEPTIGRGHHGLPHRVDRIHGLGNAWVPQVAREAFERLMGMKQYSLNRTVREK